MKLSNLFKFIMAGAAVVATTSASVRSNNNLRVSEKVDIKETQVVSITHQHRD